MPQPNNSSGKGAVLSPLYSGILSVSSVKFKIFFFLPKTNLPGRRSWCLGGVRHAT
jgi:hypothetical protein